MVGTVGDLRAVVRALPRPLGLVPTMGALHDGHLSLVRAAKKECAAVVVSVFVNPLQFGPGEDLDAYPRDLDADMEVLAAHNVDCVFAPDAAEFTPPHRLTTVKVAEISELLEGASRPGHFDGVTTVVAKLFSAAGPDRAYFGTKDYQQFAVIRRMVGDLDFGIDIVGCPIVRAGDGLALSSRNAYLSPRQRQDALALWRSLSTVQRQWSGDADAARVTLRTTLERAPGVRTDYAEIADPDTLQPLAGRVTGPAQALVAAYVGTTRLIDNVRLDPWGRSPDP